MFESKLDQTKPFIALNIAVLVVSDTRTLDTDTSGKLLAEMIARDGHKCADRKVVRDDIDAIRNEVKTWVSNPEIDVVITTGGTGFSGFDVTPEAIEPMFDKRMEGFSVLFHLYSSKSIGTSSVQSRATAGLIETTFVFCLPGSRGACRDGWDGILSQQLNYQHLPCNFVEIMPRLDEHRKNQGT